MIPRLRMRADNSEKAVNGRVFTIGSAPDCHMQLTGTPRRAAHLLFAKGAWYLHRLAQDIVVTVNGTAVDAAGTVLRHGDVLAVGSTGLQFLERDEPTAAAETVETGGDAEKLRELIATAVSLLRSRDETLFSSLVASMSRLLQCDGARLVFDDHENGGRKTIARYPQSVGLDRFSNRAIDWAHDAAHTILMHEDAWASKNDAQTSLAKNLIASIMCAPLVRGDEITGYLYLDRIDSANPFTEEDRRFCDALQPLFSEILANFQEKRTQQATIERLQKQQLAPSGGMLFESDIMAQLITLAARLAKTDSPVLVTGETGTGKELLARYIHDQSSRAAGPYKAINCGAIPENLIESELFGHEKGAFTGALARKTGLFESAQGGTVFLDEIGEMPLHLQVRLLRTLQESEIVRVGGTETVAVDVRIIAATNRDLETEVVQGRFRQDLFFRLNVLTLHLPPLRRRGDDLLLLAEFFISRYCQQFGFEHKTLSVAAKNLLLAHPWPGNIRELENAVQKAILFCETTRLTPENFSLGKVRGLAAAVLPDGVTLKDARAEAESQAIRATLEKTHGNVSLASKILDIDRKWLIKKMEELSIDAASYRRHEGDS